MERAGLDFISLLEGRRSIRKYKPIPLEPEKLSAILEAALRAPSSRGINPWEFVVVTDPAILAELSQCKPHGAAFLREASLGIVVCADPTKSDVWVEDASIAAAFILLAAHSLGLGACWIQVRARMCEENKTAGQRISEILGIPGSKEVEAIVAVGYPDEIKPPHQRGNLAWEKVHKERYGEPFVGF